MKSLTVTRKATEGSDTILIGDEIKVIVKKLSKSRATITIVAPDYIKILREELTDTEDNK